MPTSQWRVARPLWVKRPEMSTGGEHGHHLPQRVVRTRAVPTPSRSSTSPSSSPGRGTSGSRSPGPPSTPSTWLPPTGCSTGSGWSISPTTPGLGWDFAGTVTAAGPGVDLGVGSRVAGLVAGFDRDFGTFAEQLVVPAGDVALVPDGLDLVMAATVPLNGLAAAQLVDLLGDGGGRSLVTGAAGAVGAARSPAGPGSGLAGHRTRPRRGRRPSCAASARSSPPSTCPAGARSPTGACSRSRASRWSETAGSSSACSRRVPGEVRGHRPGGGGAPRRCPARAAPRSRRERAPTGRVHAVVPLDQVADTYRAVAKGGVRGRYVLRP